MGIEHVDFECGRVADSQWGVLSRAQALAAGLTPGQIRHRLGSRRWDSVLPAVYRVRGASTCPQQRLMAALLCGGPASAACGLSAAAAWGLHGGRWEPAEIVATRQVRLREQQIVARRLTTLAPDDLTRLGVLPVTTVPRTLIDMSGRVDERTLEVAMDQALRSGRLSIPRLRRRIAALGASRVPGVRLLNDLVVARVDGEVTDTELETLVHRWLRRYELPQPVFQHWVHLPDFGPARLDFAYPHLRVGVEADSFKWHSTREAFERDRARISEFASLGWIIIQTTYREIERRPDLPANRLWRAVKSRAS